MAGEEQRYRVLYEMLLENRQILNDLNQVQQGANNTNKAFEGIKSTLKAYVSLQGLKMLYSGIKEVLEVAKETDLYTRGLLETAKAYNQSQEEALKASELAREDGLIKIKEMNKGLKDLISVGYNVQEALTLTEALKDIGAFNNITGDLGTAYADFTKGVKTNSVELMENIGITKRLSSIMKEANIDISGGIDITNNLAQRQAVYNAILEEGNKFKGNAAILAEEYAGSVAKLDTSWNNLKNTLGQEVKPAAKKITSLFAEMVSAFDDYLSPKKSEQLDKQVTELENLAYIYEELSKKQNLTASEEKARIKIFEEMKKMYPAQLSNLKTEKEYYKQVSEAVKAINSDLKTKILIEVQEEKLKKLYKEKTNLTKDEIYYQKELLLSRKEANTWEKLLNDNSIIREERKQKIIQKRNILEGEYSKLLEQKEQAINNQDVKKQRLLNSLMQENVKERKKIRLELKEIIEKEELEKKVRKDIDSSLKNNESNLRSTRREIKNINSEINKTLLIQEDIKRKKVEPADIARFRDMKSLETPVKSDKETKKEIENEKKYSKAMLDLRLSLLTSDFEKMELKRKELRNMAASETNEVEKLKLLTQANEIEKQLTEKTEKVMNDWRLSFMKDKKTKLKTQLLEIDKKLAKETNEHEIKILQTQQNSKLQELKDINDSEIQQKKEAQEKEMQETSDFYDKMIKENEEYLEKKKKDNLDYTIQINEMIKQNEADMLNDKIGSYGAELALEAQQIAKKQEYFSMEQVLEEQKMALKDLAFKTGENILKQQIIQGGLGLKSMKKLMEEELKNYLITQGIQEGMKALQFTALGLGYLAMSDPRAGLAFTAAAEHAAVATAFGVGAAAMGVGKQESSSINTDTSTDTQTAVTDSQNSSVKVLEAPYPDNATIRFMLGDEINKAINEGYIIKFKKDSIER